MPEGLTPDRYESTIGFGEQNCGKEAEDVILDLRYPNDIIVQRWNDVLAVTNEPQIIFDSYIKNICIRPMPVYGVPG